MSAVAEGEYNIALEIRRKVPPPPPPPPPPWWKRLLRRLCLLLLKCLNILLLKSWVLLLKRWRPLLKWSLVLMGVGIVVLAPYVAYLNYQLGERFGALRWQEPTRVHARPLVLTRGLAMNAQTLKLELDAAAYREGDGVRPGTFARAGTTWTIASRGFADIDGLIAPSRVEVTLVGGKVESLRDLDGNRVIHSARLDVARIATLYGPRQDERRLVRLEDVPPLLTDALQAVEDRNFAHHIGIDFRGIVRAVWVNLRTRGARQGASTLTQQLARSGILDIGRERTLRRKFDEILYALLIEARYDKGAILEAYLNQVYLGQRGMQEIRGVAAGAEFWFSRRLEDLETEHVALLVGMVRGPSDYNPRRFPERATERRNVALFSMHEMGLIDDVEFIRARATPLGVSATPGYLAANRFPAYVDLVRRQLIRDYPADALQGAGLNVMTAMSPSAQAYAERAVTDTLKSLQTARRPPLQTGLVLTDVHTGQVVAAIGDRHLSEHGFNRAIDAARPVGSLLKPFVYLLALAQPTRWSLASEVDDAPISIALPDGNLWTPGNADGQSHGVVRLIDALASSYNQATVRVGMQIQPDRLAALVHTLAGVEVEPNPALILGALDESPYAMAQLYQFLASGGEVQPLRVVRGVLDTDGALLTRYDTAPDPAEDGDAIAARLITIALQHAVESGTGRRLIADGLAHLHPAGKTGTSNDGRDSWFAGWSGDHLAVIWVGNDENQVTGLYGATGAMRVWSALFQRLPTAALVVGDTGLDWQWVNGPYSTEPECPDARRFAFVSGFAPPWQPCPALAVPARTEDALDSEPESTPGERRSWRDWFRRRPSAGQ